jgi:lipid II:glycine glycyltransferase (peptidoglycan interpeptide bridge formation enzyme)
MAYSPRGPILDWGSVKDSQSILADMTKLNRQAGAFYLKIDPGIVVPLTIKSDNQLHSLQSTHALFESGWVLSNDQVQFRNTLILDVTQSEDALLAGMKQKTRYNIRLAGRKGVTIREGSLQDLDLLYQMYAETSVRDGFVIRPAHYYHNAWGDFIKHELAIPLIAEVEGQAVGALVIYRFGKTAYYLYGMSRDAHREKMPNYLLQWEAIRWAKRMGCDIYDFWGAPHEIDESEAMFGVYRFKIGFGANFVRTPGAWDFAINPWQYRMYTSLMPNILKVMRFFGTARIRTQVQDQ